MGIANYDVICTRMNKAHLSTPISCAFLFPLNSAWNQWYNMFPSKCDYIVILHFIVWLSDSHLKKGNDLKSVQKAVYFCDLKILVADCADRFFISRQENWTLTCMTSLSLFKWDGLIGAIPCLIREYLFYSRIKKMCVNMMYLLALEYMKFNAITLNCVRMVVCIIFYKNVRVFRGGKLYVSSFQSNHREQIGIRGQPSKAHLFQIRLRESDIKPRAKT